MYRRLFGTATKQCEPIYFGFIKPMIILGFVAVLLLMEPDFGATVVITGTVMAMLFLAGVRLRYYLGLMACSLL